MDTNTAARRIIIWYRGPFHFRVADGNRAE
jgi:hypothetical protein